jgi:hypothetical protein
MHGRRQRAQRESVHQSGKLDRRAHAQGPTEELEKLGELAEPILRETMTAEKMSQEVTKRLEELVEKIEARIPSGDKLRAFRAIELLEHTRGNDCKQLLETLATGPDADSVSRRAKAAVEGRQAAENE